MGVIEWYLIIFLGISFIFKFSNKKEHRLFFVISIVALCLISALRHESTGDDLGRYCDYYEKYAKYTFDQIIKIFTDEDSKDPTYYFTGWIFSRFFKDPQWWLAFVSILFCGSTGFLIAKESKLVALSVVILITLNYYSFSFSGLRQTIALSLIVMSYPFLKNRKPIPFILMVIFSSLYHKTALIFLIIYPISNIKIGRYHFIVAMICLVIFVLFKERFRNLLNELLQEDRYQWYLKKGALTLTFSGFIIQACIFVYTMFYYKSTITENPRSIILYNLAFVGLMFQLYSSFVAEFFRISMYFSIFNIILIPEVSLHEKRYNIRLLLQLLLFGVLLLYMYKDGITPYYFFWQEVNV